MFSRPLTCRRVDPAFRRRRTLRSCICAFAVAWFIGAGLAVAHPLGNDSITHFNVLYVLPDRLEVDFMLDFAENPAAFLESSEMDTNRDGQVSREEQEAWLGLKAREYPALLTARIDDKELSLSLVPERIDPMTGRQLTTSKVIVPMLGPMGMTYRLVVRYVAEYPQLGPGEHILTYEDKTYPQHVGLKLILLEPPPVLCRLYGIDADSLAAGPVPEAVVDAFSNEGVALTDAAAARIVPAEATAAGQPRWRLRDGTALLDLVAAGDDADVYALPYCRFLEPHPPFVSEDTAVFRYEQYDPVNLPDVRQATVRFTVVSEAAAGLAGEPGSPATAPSASTSPASADGATTDASRGRAETAGLSVYATTFLDPTYNPLQVGDYERQARKMISLLQGRWGVVLFLLVTGTAFFWGAAHALMPGHAKTVVAAYLISQHGTYWHAAALAIIVTVTHTALVVIMGVVIWVYQESNPRLAPTLQLWLGLVAGLLVAGMGLALAWRGLTGRLAHHHDHDHHHHHHGEVDTRSWWRKLFTHSHPHVPGVGHDHPHSHAHDHAHDHSHGHSHAHSHAHEHSHAHSHDAEHGHRHGHSHSHHDHDHGHGHHHHEHAYAPADGSLAATSQRRSSAHNDAAASVHGRSDRLTFRMLLMLGITGGIVPCPAATIIMFMGIGANVVGGALYAIAVFSLGLALTLMLIGSLALASRRYAAKILADAAHEHDLTGLGRRLLLQVVPTLSGLVVTVLGGMIAAHYVCLMRGIPSPFPWLG